MSWGPAPLALYVTSGKVLKPSHLSPTWNGGYHHLFRFVRCLRGLRRMYVADQVPGNHPINGNRCDTESSFGPFILFNSYHVMRLSGLHTSSPSKSETLSLLKELSSLTSPKVKMKNRSEVTRKKDCPPHRGWCHRVPSSRTLALDCQLSAGGGCAAPLTTANAFLTQTHRCRGRRLLTASRAPKPGPTTIQAASHKTESQNAHV